MRKLLITGGAALLLASNVFANAAPPRTKPTTKSTATKIEVEPSVTTAPSSGSTLLIGGALTLAAVSGGLLVVRRRGRSGPDA